MYKEIEVYDYMNHILKQLKKGVLLTTKKDGKVNTMTISWGKIGIEWSKLIFCVYVRQNRQTHTMLDSGEFTINIPYNQSVGKILGYCGTKSGKDTDKIKDLDLTLVDGREVSAPAIKELPLTLECKIIYKQLQDSTAIPDAFKEEFYPQDISSDFCGANKDYHTMFYGEIVSAYIVEPIK